MRHAPELGCRAPRLGNAALIGWIKGPNTCSRSSSTWLASRRRLGGGCRLPSERGAARRCSRSTAVAAAAQVLERSATPQTQPGLRLDFAGGAITAGGVGAILEDVSSEVFVSRADGDALVLGIEAAGGATAMHDVALGKLVCQRFLACARCKLWWMTPEWGSTAREVPPETQFLLLELAAGGPYAVLLPLIDRDTFRATLRPAKFSQPATRFADAEERLHLRIESGAPDVTERHWNGALYLAAGWDPYTLVDSAVAGAAALSGGAKPRTAKSLPPSLDVFGWCTWDAFYSRVSARGLHVGLQSLADGGITPRLLIIDDGWQCTDVDAALRQPVSQKLHLAEPMPELDETQGEFIEAELEMLSMSARDVPAGSTLGVALEALTADEENLTHHKPGKSNPDLPWRKSKSERRRKRFLETGRNLDYDSDDSSSWDLDEEDEAELQEILKQAVSRRQAGAGGLKGDAALQPPALSEGEQEREGGLVRAKPESRQEGGAQPVAAELTSESPRQLPMMWLLSAVGQRFVGLFVGLFQALLVKVYQYIVDPAPPDSLPNRVFTSLAAGPLRTIILEFLATSGDFTRRLTAVEANSKFSSPFAGPEDYFSGRPPRLGRVVRSLKRRFKLSYVYCWHGLPAYWSGVAVPEEAPRVAKYGARLIFAEPTRGLYEIDPSAAWNPTVISGVGVVDDVESLYGDMHRYLADAGVTGVKVDCQAGVGLVGSALGGGPSLAAKYHAALEDSVAAHFEDNHCINCMCHSTENLYRMRDTAVVRASDDFYPRNPASSAPHIAACAFNSVFLGALAQPDWDMFHSSHPAARLHATARAVSGGAVYVSDYPGQHGFDVLRSLVLSDGSVLRAQLPGRPTRDSLFCDVLRDGVSLLKVWNMNACNGFVAAFHLQGSSWDRGSRQFRMHAKHPTPLEKQVRPRDVDALAASAGPDASWAAYSSASGQLARLRTDEGVGVRLQSADSAVVTFAPVLEAGGIAFAAVGLPGMLNSGGAVLRCGLQAGARHAAGAAQNGKSARQENSRATGEVMARGSGEFLMYASERPAACLLGGEEIEYSYEEGRLTVQLPAPLDSEPQQHQLQVLF